MNAMEARIAELAPLGAKPTHKELGWMAGILAFSLTLLSFAGGMRLQEHNHDPFSQQNFPCAEDEGLMYGPEFGADRVGCVNVGDWKVD